MSPRVKQTWFNHTRPIGGQENLSDGVLVGEIINGTLTGSSFANVNRPGGLTDRLDDDFDRALSAGSSDGTISSWATSGGWSSDSSWYNDGISTIVDASGPNGFSGKRCLRTNIPVGGGGGALTLYRSLGGSKSKVYVYVAWKYEVNFHHNNVSEKFIYFDHGGGSNIWQHADGHEQFFGVDDPSNLYPGDSGYLRANQEPNGTTGGFGDFPVAPFPADNVWAEVEIYVDMDADTVQWWRDGVLYASYTGVVDFNPSDTTELVIDDTWGGGGTKSNTAGRIIDRVIFATN